MNLLGDGGLHILQHLDLEESPKEIGQKEAGAVHALVRIRVTVISADSLVGYPEESPGHMRQEARLLIGIFRAADMRVQLITQ